MHAKILVILLITISCVKLGQGLACYQHDYCLGGCPTLSSRIVQCQSIESKCWKFTSPLGTKRGCADNRCAIQIDASLVNTASICCSGDLCNTAIQMKTSSIILIFASLLAFVYTWCL